MTVDVARRRTRKTTKAASAPAAPDRRVRIALDRRDRADRLLVPELPAARSRSAPSTCPGCRTHLVDGVQLGKASLFVALGLVGRAGDRRRLAAASALLGGQRDARRRDRRPRSPAALAAARPPGAGRHRSPARHDPAARVRQAARSGGDPAARAVALDPGGDRQRRARRRRCRSSSRRSRRGPSTPTRSSRSLRSVSAERRRPAASWPPTSAAGRAARSSRRA